MESLEVPELTQGVAIEDASLRVVRRDQVERKDEVLQSRKRKGAKRALEKEEAKATVEVTRAASLFAWRRGEEVREKGKESEGKGWLVNEVERI